METARVAGYIDGFNVYYGFKRKGWRSRLWLDYRALFEAICEPHHDLVRLNYFTALSNQQESRRRQQTYLSALEANGGLEIHRGRVVSRPMKCGDCGYKWKRAQEKETDVAIAIELMKDAFSGEIDEFWLMTRDSDLIPAVKAVQEVSGAKVLIVPPPSGAGPSTGGQALVEAANQNVHHISDRGWRQARLPDPVQKQPGATRLYCPDVWKTQPQVAD